MTFIYELDPYSLEMHQMSENELPMSSISKVIVWQTDRHGQIWQTDTTEIVYHATSRVVNKCNKVAFIDLLQCYYYSALVWKYKKN